MRRKRLLRQLATFVVALMLVTAIPIMAPADSAVDDLDPTGEADALGVIIGVTAFTLGVAACGELDGGNIVPACANGATADELQKADAEETELSIYERLVQQDQNNENYLTTSGNYLKDTKSIARMEGKAAYIRALNNGSGEASARLDARQAVSAYYATKQIQLINSWNTTVITVNSTHQTAENTSGVSDTYSNFIKGKETQQYSINELEINGTETGSVTLVNSTTVNQVMLRAYFRGYDPGDGPNYHPVGVTTGNQSVTGGGGTGNYLPGILVEPPNSNYDQQDVMHFEDWKQQMNTIEAQNQQVQDDLDSFINATYDSYTRDEIDSSEISDPYLDAREFSPDANYGTWVMRSLAAVGIAPPENVSNVGTMNITTESRGAVSGLLLSQGTHGFEIGTQYDASNLTGKQVVVDFEDNEQITLSGNFTVTDATTVDGNSTSTLHYTDIGYNTSDTEDYRKLQERLDNLTAEINAYQQALRNQSGSGGLLGGLPSLPTWQWLLIGGGIFGVLASRGRARSPY